LIPTVKHLARLILPIYMYKSDTLRIGYAGYSKIKMNYYARLLAGKISRPVFSGLRCFWKIPDLINAHNLDVIVAEISPYTLDHFHKRNGFILPEWITMRIRIDRPIDEICSRSISHFPDVLKRIRKYKLSYEILTDSESFNYFNEKLYLPYMRIRHGEEALIENLNIFWKLSPSPVLMVIKENGIIVAGSLLRRIDNNLHGLRMGILDGNEEYMRHGVIGAIYYFSILEGQKMGCSYLDVGGTRPFLTDRLTRYKMGLNAEFILDNDQLKEYLWLGVADQSHEVKQFMSHNPFIYLNHDKKLAKSIPT
jgi:hypothetical protein